MIISLNWLKKYTTIEESPDQLSERIGARLVEIEQITDHSHVYDGVVVAKVVECRPIEGTDHLNVTKIDDGGVTEGVDRDEHGFVQVVCGAPNVRAGLAVAWLPPGATVPSTSNDTEPFVLTTKELRGVMSNGMLASAKELALFDDHSGILELDIDLHPGDSFARVYELDDQLFDIENKSLTHRPDTFGIIGFAREVAAIEGKAFHTPDWLRTTTPSYGEKQGDIVTPSVTIDEPELSARYQAVVLQDADGTRQSPVLIQTYLARVGLRPINAIVDVTNYLMMVSGQPLHAFDYDKVLAVGGGRTDIHVRRGRDGESLTLLDGRTITLVPEDIVIAVGETAIGLAGAMGGASTVIDGTTRNIIIESATFNLYSLRSTQMRHGIFSEAITRFTKGQPAALTAPVLGEAIHLMNEWAGAKRVSEVADAYPSVESPRPIMVSSETINHILGSDLSEEAIIVSLQNSEFNVEKKDDLLSVIAPYWRADIHIKEDIVEEVGRLNGFDTIVSRLPLRDYRAVNPDEFDRFRSQLRQTLLRTGANEVLTYSFVHGDVLRKATQEPTNSYRIINSISPDLQYYRQSLTPSLLNLIFPNSKQGFESFALYEMNKVHPKEHGLTDEHVPQEIDMLAFTIVSPQQPGAPYYQAKKYLDFIARTEGLTLVYKPIEEEPRFAVTAPFEYRRSAYVSDAHSGVFIGIVGEYKKTVARGFKLPEYSSGFEIDPRGLLEATQKRAALYTPLSKYPSTERDICFQVDHSVLYDQIIEGVRQSLENVELEVIISPVDIYQPDNGATKNITIRMRLTANDRTLTSEAVNQIVTRVADHLHETIGSRVI